MPVTLARVVKERCAKLRAEIQADRKTGHDGDAHLKRIQLGVLESVYGEWARINAGEARKVLG